MKRYLTPGLLIVAAAFMVLLAPSLASAQSSQQVTISGTEFSLNPSAISVPQGQVIHFTFTNSGKYPHNLKVELPSQSIEKTLFSSNLQPGETRDADFTFTTAGNWEIYCPVDGHEANGMKGTLQVVAVAAGMPATGSPATSLPLLSIGGLALVAAGLLVQWKRRSMQA